VGVCTCGFCNVWPFVFVGFVMCGCVCGFCNVWVCICGFCNVWTLCGCVCVSVSTIVWVF